MATVQHIFLNMIFKKVIMQKIWKKDAMHLF